MARPSGKDNAHLLQVSALKQSRNLEKSRHPISLKSFYVGDSDSDVSISGLSIRPRSVAGDYPIDNHGKHCVPNVNGLLETGKRFRNKVKKIADREEKTLNITTDSDEVIETARGYPTKAKNTQHLSKLVESALDIHNRSARGLSLAIMTKQLKAARMKLFATRTAIEVQPKLVDNLKLATSTNEKVRIPSRIVTENRPSALPKAKGQTLYMKLMTEQDTSSWLLNYDEDAVSNPAILDYLNHKFDSEGFQNRITLYVDHVRSDVDKVVTGKFYNNIMLGKRMFGPSKKQMFGSSIIGGIERRFEILDNQVNHIPFTHEAFDKNVNLCRNKNVQCRDSTRVVLWYPPGENDFIHANRISGGPLFNDFIITQAPMENTIGDFWRMIWQEKTPYIFMLISRKSPEKCAKYWPRETNSEPIYCHGLTIYNKGVNTSCDPLFQVTSIQIIGPNGEEHRLEHWQGNMNNSSNIVSPLNILRIARNCSRPIVIHDTLGISRAACLVATEIAICSLIKGPSYKHLIQQSVQFLRAHRPYSVETPMQFIFIHRCLHHMFRNVGLVVKGMDTDYQKWLRQRTGRMFVDDLNAPIPGYRLLSPKVDPDLLRQARRPARPNYRREAPDCVGEWPLPILSVFLCTGGRREIISRVLLEGWRKVARRALGSKRQLAGRVWRRQPDYNNSSLGGGLLASAGSLSFGRSI